MTVPIPPRLKNLLRTLPPTRPLKVAWRKRGGWLGRRLTPEIPKAPRKILIEDLAWRTNRCGARPLAIQYGQAGAVRRPSEVRSGSRTGDLFAWLATERRPQIVVEFGAAFGVSGIYFLAGLNAAGGGHLYSYEINPVWADFARRNMSSIGRRFTLTLGAFEDHVHEIGKSLDLAFVDGIHTADFIHRQYEIIRPLASPGAILMFDDIDFATGDMREGWQAIADRPEVVAACEIDGRLGIAELV